MLKNKLVDMFFSFVAIPSPSGKEGEVAMRIKKYLDLYGIAYTTDKSGFQNESETGNIIAKLPGSKKAILFVAHMDTVEKGDKKITPIIKKGNITSDGTTILGADDKAAVAALIHALAEIKKMENSPTVYAIFTTREEAGKMGSSCIEKIPGVTYAFNLDGQGQQGTFMHKSLGQMVFKIVVTGEASHSALAPEKGRNAIAAAAHFISHIKQGARKKVLVNIGTIHGGRSVNVVSSNVEIQGEIRGYKTIYLKEEFENLKKQLEKSCNLFSCLYSIEILEDASVPVMEETHDKTIIEIVKNASQKLHLPFILIEGRATTEANFLFQKGYKVLTVCRGGTNAHSFQESITAQELENYKNLIVNIAKEVSLLHGN